MGAHNSRTTGSRKVDTEFPEACWLPGMHSGKQQKRPCLGQVEGKDGQDSQGCPWPPYMQRQACTPYTMFWADFPLAMGTGDYLQGWVWRMTGDCLQGWVWRRTHCGILKQLFLIRNTYQNQTKTTTKTNNNNNPPKPPQDSRILAEGKSPATQ